MPRNYRKRDLVYVAIKVGPTTINYGFLTGLKPADRTDFGQIEITTNLPTAFCFGANAPKPARASKREPTGYVSSYCADNKINTLKDAGYRTSRKKQRSPQLGGLSKTVYVTIEGIKYAWNTPAIATEPQGYNSAGIQSATANDIDLIYGAEFPKPPRYATEISGADNLSGTFSTFVDPSNEAALITAGWQKVKGQSYYPGFEPVTN
jgi:hypothetical protein